MDSISVITVCYIIINFKVSYGAVISLHKNPVVIRWQLDNAVFMQSFHPCIYPGTYYVQLNMVHVISGLCSCGTNEVSANILLYITFPIQLEVSEKEGERDFVESVRDSLM